MRASGDVARISGSASGDVETGRAFGTDGSGAGWMGAKLFDGSPPINVSGFRVGDGIRVCAVGQTPLTVAVMGLSEADRAGASGGGAIRDARREAAVAGSPCLPLVKV